MCFGYYELITDPHLLLWGWSTNRGYLGRMWSSGWFLHTIQPLSLIIHSPRSILRSAFFLDSNHHRTAFNSGSSFWTAAQLVTCIPAKTHPVVTPTSCSSCWSFSMTAGFSFSALYEVHTAAPSKMACTASGSRWVVTQLKPSAAALSLPFWYSSLKSYLARALTQWCPGMSKLGIDIIYINRLLLVLTRKGWYNRYSLKCSVMAHFNAYKLQLP